jgi:gamma-glutamylcyclotransferase (GGCT)/AIG2-like uncharacterized protein YtfP
MPFLFVYGPFQRGYSKHYILESEFAPFLGKAIVPNYELYNCCSLPVAIPGPDGCIVGELYLVDDFALSRIDEEVGVKSGLFRREKAMVVMENGFTTQAEIYVFTQFEPELIRRKFARVIGDTKTDRDIIRPKAA